MLYHRHETLVAPDGHDIHTQLWAPDGQASCVIQILHGLGEHSGRYARLAGRAVERGLAVCIHDHRGHGNHCDDLGHFADRLFSLATAWAPISPRPLRCTTGQDCPA